MRHEIWAVVKDPGEVAGTLPVVEELERHGHPVRLITDGWASSQAFPGRERTVADSAEALMTEPLPRVLLAGICSGGGVGRDLLPLLRGKTTSVILHDLWGVEPSYRGAEYQPDYVITNDKVAKKNVRDAWPGLASDHVFTTGFPALDKYAAMDVAAEGAKAREALALGDRPLVLFAGQGFTTSHALAEVAAVLSELRADCYFMPRPHPRMRQNYASETGPWQHALAGFRGRLIVDWFQQCTSSQLIAACAVRGVVVSMYSTMLLEAAALRTQAVSILYPDWGIKAMQAENGMTQFPLVRLGCVAGAGDRDRLFDCLQQALAGGLNQRAAQKRHVRVDGHNARRAAEKILGLL